MEDKVSKTRIAIGLTALAALALFLAGAGPQAQDKGIGPITELKLGPVDKELAAKGQTIFDEKCAACHGLTEDKAGPALGNVLSQVSPEFVVNFILNTTEMEQKDGRIMDLIKKYGMPMPSPGLDKDQAMAVLEYLRTTKK